MLLCYISLFLNRSLYESESEHHILFLPYDQMSNDQMSYDQMSNVQMSNYQMTNGSFVPLFSQVFFVTFLYLLVH